MCVEPLPTSSHYIVSYQCLQQFRTCLILFYQQYCLRYYATTLPLLLCNPNRSSPVLLLYLRPYIICSLVVFVECTAHLNTSYCGVSAFAFNLPMNGLLDPLSTRFNSPFKLLRNCIGILTTRRKLHRRKHAFQHL